MKVALVEIAAPGADRFAELAYRSKLSGRIRLPALFFLPLLHS
jgi:hypothetical protein